MAVSFRIVLYTRFVLPYSVARVNTLAFAQHRVIVYREIRDRKKKGM